MRYGNYGWNEFVAIPPRDHLGGVQVEVGDQAIGSAEVDAYNTVVLVTEVYLKHSKPKVKTSSRE